MYSQHLICLIKFNKKIIAIKRSNETTENIITVLYCIINTNTLINVLFFLCISECVFGTGQMKVKAQNAKLTSAQNMVTRYVAELCTDVITQR